MKSIFRVLTITSASSIFLLTILITLVFEYSSYGWGVNSFSNNVYGQVSSSYPDLPTLRQKYSANLTEPVIVLDGSVVAPNSNGLNLEFNPWGGIDNKLTLGKSFLNNSKIPMYEISGKVGNSSLGFDSKDLQYAGKFISLITGNIVKLKDHQLAFSFEVIGTSGAHYNLIFVNGFLSTNGWIGNSYYESLPSYSSKLIDLPKFMVSQNDAYDILKKVTIVAQANSDIDKAQFRVDLGNTTTNIPARVNPGYFVVGNISLIPTFHGETTYVIHNLIPHKVINMTFPINSPSYSLSPNGWSLDKITNYENASNKYIIIEATKPLKSTELDASVIAKINLVASVSNIGSKDILFIVILSVGAGFLYYKRESSA